jgi:outer membrane immunogenic protein
MFVRSLTLGVAAVALLSSGAFAADLIIPTTPQPIYESAGFSWDGLYAGVEAGGLFSDNGAGDTDTRGLVGAIVGVNFTVADPIVLGVELQGDYVFESDLGDDDAGMFLALGHVGAVVTDQVLVYAAGGFGVVGVNGDSNGIYALGAGVDFAVTDNVSVRGEILGLGNFDDANDDFFDSAKATVGVFYHF